MREIKFRAKEKATGEWLIGSLQPKDDEVSLAVFFACLKVGRLIDETLGLFTNLPDKNSKEIYEGDIVTHPLCVKEPHKADEPCETFIGRIVFEVDRGQYFAINTKRNGYVIEMSEACKFETIGNIWEHSYLLDKKMEK